MTRCWACSNQPRLWGEDMTLRPVPGDYAPGDTPTAAEMNGLKDHAAYHVDRYTTVLRRGTLVQVISNNVLSSANAVAWQTVVNGRNDLGWSVGTPTRVPIPSGADGRYSIVFTGEFAANATGKRYTGLAKNGALIKPGLFVPGDATLVAWLATSWETEVVGGDYLEVWVYQNSGGNLNLNVSAESPEVALRRLD